MSWRESSHPCWRWCLPAHIPPQQHTYLHDNAVLDITPLQIPHGMWRAVLSHQQCHISREGWLLWDSVCLAQPRASASLLGCKLCLPWWTGSALMYSRSDPVCLCPWSEAAGWILDWRLPGNTNLPSNYLPAMQVGTIAYLAARVIWMWTSAAVSHLCRSCTPTLFPLPPS